MWSLAELHRPTRRCDRDVELANLDRYDRSLRTDSHARLLSSHMVPIAAAIWKFLGSKCDNERAASNGEICIRPKCEHEMKVQQPQPRPRLSDRRLALVRPLRRSFVRYQRDSIKYRIKRAVGWRSFGLGAPCTAKDCRAHFRNYFLLSFDV